MKKHKLYYKLCLIAGVSVLFLSFSITVQPLSNILNNLLFKIERFNNWYPQQKVYLHTDKSTYNASETVWFKAYLVNASNHKPDSSSTNLYVELIDPGGNIVQQKMLKLDKGFTNGDFSFKDTIPEGMYRLRAFTQIMVNTSREFTYTRDIYISNPDFTNYATRHNVITLKKVSKHNQRKSEKYDVSFFPEGGHMINGVENKIGFKATNHMGRGADVSGRVVDRNNNVIVEFKSLHAGIGSFRFTPQSGIKYTAVVITPEGRENKYPLPVSVDEGITINVESEPEGRLKISMLSAFPGKKFPANTAYFLIVHSRGIPVFTTEFDLKNETNSVLIAKSSLPSGIIHLTLFNANSKPVSERLVFINNADALRINIIQEKSSASPHEKVDLKVQVRDKLGNPVKGNFSLSIAEAGDLSSTENILINLLLNSDIRGKIERPEHYFTDFNSAREAELDNLLLTQGWRRFNWVNVIENEQRMMLTTKENYIAISGKITKDLFGIPLRDIPVTLSILNEYNDVFTSRTRYDGRFKFDGLQYNDTLLVRIEARRKSGRKNLVIALDVKSADRVKDMNYITYQQIRRPGPEGRFKPIVKATEEDKDDPFYEQNNRIDRIHSEPRDVIIVDDRFQGYTDVAQVLQGRIPGVMVSGHKVIIRGATSFYSSTDPLFLVDNVPVDPSNALSMPPSQVARIEVLKGPDAAIYGSRGGNGVIAIYTKRGKFMIRGMIEFTMQGYSSPKEYYSPKYPYRSDDPYLDDRRTLLWVPNLLTDISGNAETSFYTSDVKGNYIISVEGINYSGTPGAAIAGIAVK